MSALPLVLQKANRMAAVKALIFDAFALSFIYFIPAISHMLGLKLYLIEPMRLMLIIAMVHTHRRNAYMLALTLPLFSFLISTHPVLIKTGLISAELVINVFLFFFLVKKMHTLAAIFISIWASKIIYYILKYLTILLIWPGDSLISTPIYIQLITSSAFSIYLFLMMKKRA
jgi:hypothetical protein